MSTFKPNLTFRVVRMPSGHGTTCYVAIAWNYDHGQLIATRPYSSYTLARHELDSLVSERGCYLRWFDGEYQVAGDGAQLEPVPCPTVDPELGHKRAHQA